MLKRTLASRTLVGLVCVWACFSAQAQTFPANFSHITLASGLQFPTAMTVAPNGNVYFCQQTGALRVWQSGIGVSTVNTFTVDSNGERGLIGIALDPDVADNRFAYIHYTTTTPATHNRISRITLDAAGTAMVPLSESTLLDIDDLSSATNHNGGAIHFGADGKLYACVGDNANGANSQSISTLKGKILRINPDPMSPIPADNPASFPGIADSPTGNNRAIWAVGLRNPFTFAVHPGTGRIFIDDVGESTWEEIDDGVAGVNYGWSITEGFFTQGSFPNFTEPLIAYHHSNGSLNNPIAIGSFVGHAIIGGAFYAPFAGVNPNFPISFSDDYFFGDEVNNFIRTFDPAANNGAGFATSVSAVVGLAIATDNTLLYLAGAGGGAGSLVKVTYTGTSGVCCTTGTCVLSNGLNCTGSGVFAWGTVACSPNPCAESTGACCDGSTCSSTTAGACTGPNTSFVADAPCNPPGNYVAPCCRADFNHNLMLTVQDLFDFLAAYFSGSPTADINANGADTVQDIFDFLAAYFAGCP